MKINQEVDFKPVYIIFETKNEFDDFLKIVDRALNQGIVSNSSAQAILLEISNWASNTQAR